MSCSHIKEKNVQEFSARLGLDDPAARLASYRVAEPRKSGTRSTCLDLVLLCQLYYITQTIDRMKFERVATSYFVLRDALPRARAIAVQPDQDNPNSMAHAQVLAANRQRIPSQYTAQVARLNKYCRGKASLSSVAYASANLQHFAPQLEDEAIDMFLTGFIRARTCSSSMDEDKTEMTIKPYGQNGNPRTWCQTFRYIPADQRPLCRLL
ncbi:hypothetical protein K491DRAFT_673237 [Lophiostoma macrostomum CBS 122681]|uniref:Uncharacterized protein n=1 Tax=Lophiostoma macrostomum CBS 122681 TaxID=1314788 RepID=A0A6A6TT98_9PLEO|nr:hypothetical protein K491DRAFT_673237 [Lophiostoma macrostomum CBS 122681]